MLLNVLPKRLAGRIILLMSLAMLPLGLISIYQTRAVIREAEELSDAARLAEIVVSASAIRALLFNALGVAEGLGGVVAQSSIEACNRTLEEHVRTHDTYIAAGFTRADGQRLCSSSGRQSDFLPETKFRDAVTDPIARVDVGQDNTGVEQPVLLVSSPIYDAGGLAGFMTVSLAQERAISAMRDAFGASATAITIVDKHANLVASTTDMKTALDWLPDDGASSDLLDQERKTIQTTFHDGAEHSYFVVPLIKNSLFLVGSWPTVSVVVGRDGFRSRFAMMFPVLMWVAGIGVAFFGLQRLVVRHVRQLRSAMRKFALGERNAGALELKDPPEELAETERAFNRMSLIIAEAEAQQDDDLRDKEVLLREVHHRVKNNLQLIASIMNMQARNTQSAEAKEILASLQRRVRGLALLHRSLYVTPDMTSIDSAELVETVVDDVSQVASIDQLEVTTNLDSFPVYPDQAVPLAMLVAEALTNAFKYAGLPNEGAKQIKVTMDASAGDTVLLKVWNSREPEQNGFGETMRSDGLGNRLMAAFVTQLEGTLKSDVAEGSYELTVSFPITSFASDGEAGHAA